MASLFKFNFIAPNRVAKTFVKKSIDPEIKKSFYKALQRGAGAADNSGMRCWPNQTKDPKYGIRFDYGEKFQDKGLWYRNLVMQLNVNAEQAAIKAAAKLHDKRAEVRVRLNDEGTALHPEVTEELVVLDLTTDLEEGV